MNRSYAAALDDAQAELKQVTTKLSLLFIRKTALENLVKTLTPLVSGAKPAAVEDKPSSPEESPRLLPHIPISFDNLRLYGTAPADDEALWKRIAKAMKPTPGFTIIQAARTVEKNDGRDMGPNKSQIVRNALVRHPEMFERNAADGTFTVIGTVD